LSGFLKGKSLGGVSSGLQLLAFSRRHTNPKLAARSSQPTAFFLSSPHQIEQQVLSIFRTNQLLYSILLLMYAALLHLSVFVLREAWTPVAPGVFSAWVYQLLGGASGMSAEITAILLLTAQAAGINAIVLEHRLGEEQNLFPGLFYILISSMLPGMMHLSPALMGNTFLIIAMSELFRTYKNPQASGGIFNVGFWTAVASLFVPAYLVFLILGFVGLNSLRGLDLKERLMLLSGAVVPYGLAGVVMFWNGQLLNGIHTQFQEAFAVASFVTITGFSFWAAASGFSLLVLLALTQFGGLVYRKTIQVQKKVSLLYWMLLIGGLSPFVIKGIQIENWLSVAIPLGIVLGFVFSNLPRRWSESLHLMLLATVLILHYKQFLLP